MALLTVSLPLCLCLSLCLGCHNKVPQTGRPKQQKCIVSRSGGWRSEIKVSVGWVSCEASLLWLTDGHLLPVSSYHLPSVPLCPDFLFIRTPAILIRAQPNDLVYNLITSSEILSPKCPGVWGALGLQHMSSGVNTIQATAVCL